MGKFMLRGKQIYLKFLTEDNASGNYRDWITDPEINQFLECRWSTFSRESLREYLNKVNDGEHNFLFGMYTIKGDQHIGNIKIGNVHPVHRHADIGLLIGEKSYWGKKIGTEAIDLATHYAFEQLNLNKVYAVVYENNLSSCKAFLKNGYKEAGKFKEHIFFKGTFIDLIIVEKIRGSK